MVSGGMTCVKYLLFCFNLLFAISGITLSTVGIIIHTVYYHYSQFVDRSIESAPVVLIIVGVIVFVIAFFGCCGAVKENHCMIMTFAVFLLIIFTLELAAGISGYVRRAEIDEMLQTRLNVTMQEYPTSVATKQSWNIMQHELKCCGRSSGPSDWHSVFPNGTLPHTCCPDTKPDGSCTMNSPDKYETPCLKKLEEIFIKYATLIGGVSIGIGLTQLIGVICACCLARSIRREYETV